ncbi:MAG: esterase family protein [Alistipes sp.]|nr:esterase family protein [Alistipes sp.]
MLKIRYISILAIALVLLSCSTTRRAATNYPQLNNQSRHAGILEQCFYECSVDGPKERRMYIYLPDNYYHSTESYPVLYLLHGARGNELSWIIKGDLLSNIDSLTTNGLMERTIIVLPNTNQYNNDKDFAKSRTKGAVESFFENDGMVEASFVEDVVKKVDSTYRTIPQKSHRAIAGLSIGALQAIHISATHPDTFDYIGLFSPMVRPFVQHSQHSSFYKHLRQKQQLQFAHTPKLYWIMIGKKDFFYPRMNSYNRYLNRKGYQHEYFISRGGHQWYNWSMYCDMFMQRLWK